MLEGDARSQGLRSFVTRPITSYAFAGRLSSLGRGAQVGHFGGLVQTGPGIAMPKPSFGNVVIH